MSISSVVDVASTTEIGSPGDRDVEIQVNDTDSTVEIVVTGESGKTIRWNGRVHITEIGW